MSESMRRRIGLRRLLAALGAAVIVSGCSAPEGTPDDDGYTGADWASELPTCAEIWVEGGTVPDPYLGCVDEEGLSVPVLVRCSSGTGDLASRDGLFGREGAEIHEGARTSEQYQRAAADCAPDA